MQPDPARNLDDELIIGDCPARKPGHRLQITRTPPLLPTGPPASRPAMLLHGSHPQSPMSSRQHSSPMAATTTATTDWETQARQLNRKRKAETQDNERLSKRLSLLNIEHNGSKLYVPVETPSDDGPAPTWTPDGLSASQQLHPAQPPGADDSMQLDNSKHKVYIYNIDDELASDSESDDGRLIFLPDIEKHLRANRIPPPVLPNSDGELAGMQVVLYSDPKSLTVPEERDGVRRAILDARRRLRQQQKEAREGTYKSAPTIETQASSPIADATTGSHPALDPEDMDMD